MIVSFLLSFLFLKAADSDILHKFRLNNKLFTYRLYWEHFTTLDGNFAFSPILTQNILALAAVGADADTVKEIYKAAYLPYGLCPAMDMYTQVHQFLLSTPSLSIYNEIFVGVNELNSFYEYLTKMAFNAVVTRDNPNTVHNFTLSFNVLILSPEVHIASHLSMTTSWVHNFLPYDSLMEFRHLNGTISLTEMIYTKTTALLSEDTAWNLSFIEFPFTDDNLSFTLVFPKIAEDFPEFEQVFHRVLYEPIKRKVDLEIVLPKLWLSYPSYLDSILKPLGMELTFSEKADFSGIGNFSQAKIPVGLHVSVFNISEVPVAEDSKGHNFTISSFTINHPFIYILRHKVLGIIMIGRYV